MTETHEPVSVPSAVGVPSTPPADRRPSRLNQAAAWVAIVAGVVFIVGAVFFTGYILGKNSDGGSHHGPQRMLLTPFHKGMGPGGQMGPEDGPRSARLTPPSPTSIPPSP